MDRQQPEDVNLQKPENIEDEEVETMEAPPRNVNVPRPHINVLVHSDPLPNPSVGRPVLIVGNQAQLRSLHTHIVDIENLGELVNRRGEPPMEFDDIRQVMDVIEIDDEDEDIDDEDDEQSNPGNDQPRRRDDDDSDEDPNSDFGTLAAIVYIETVNKN